jgi:two-component system sensor histidine kinase RegB
MLSIIDDGPGFSPDVIEKIGEPYVTTRPRRAQARSGGADDADDGHEGMGLGFFIAKTLLERTKARVEIANRQDGRIGAQVTVTWPREAIEADSAFPNRM